MSTEAELSASPAVKAELRRYTITDDFYMTAISEAVYASLLSPLVFNEKHNIKLKPGFNTACWAFMPPHEIILGTEIFEKTTVKKGLSELQQKKYIANHYHHELGHARFTERNLGLVNSNLKTFNCEFQLFNLFEDANMEHRYCAEADYCFDWLSLETLMFNNRPESLLLALIQAEGNVAAVKVALTETIPSEGLDEPGKVELQKLLPRVVEYYKRILLVKRSMQLMPILKDWLDEFGRPPESKEKQPSDLEVSNALMSNPKFAEGFLKDAKPVKQAPKGTANSEEPPKAKIGDNKIALVKKGKVLGTSVPVDLHKAQLLADKLKKIFEEKSRYSSTVVPQKRISMRNYMVGLPIYRRKDVKAVGPKKIFFLFDCSGSMGGRSLIAGKLLVTSLNMLARLGLVTGDLALSAVNDKQEACHEVYAFPVAQEIIDKIDANGWAEGLEPTLTENIKRLKEADHVLVYTDGQISDIPLNKTALHLQNIHTWGLYVGETDKYLEDMLQYFDKVVIRSTVEAVIDAIILQIK